MRMVSEENSPYLREADNLALYHHEKWDGSGYPTGRKGEQIPLSARIMAVADVFDALVSKRSYKDGLSYEDAMAIIQSGAGTHFDPVIVKAFAQAGDEVRRTMEANMDI
jgi:HD-GYP domain-containing protein (c-di-GMP phosphodiesterase class II)